MKTNLFRTLAALAALALLAPIGMVQAQEVQLASHAELNNLYARLAELESRIAASNVSGCGCADACGGGCNGGCGGYCDDCCCGCPGFVGGAEILWLEVFESDGVGAFDFNEGFRWWLGYQGAGGLGVRVRAFDYQQTVGASDVDIQSFDFEVYDAVQLGCNWDLIIGGGVRYLDFLNDTNGGGDDFIAGTGLVLTAELYRHISDRAALYAIGRTSIVGGDGAVGGVIADNLTTFTTEIQIGAQLHREWNGGLLFARAGWEAQTYDEPQENDELITLLGGVLSVGLMR